MDRLTRENTVIMIVDVQERLAAAMPEGTLNTLIKNVCLLIEAAKVLGVKVLTTEQYPKGLGPTLGPIAERLPSAAMSKLTFDACSDLAIARTLSSYAPRSVVVVGMESHVCVFQTAREIARRGIAVHVLADAVASRTEDNRRLGLSLCERAGAVISGTETTLFDLLGAAGTEEFKAVSKLVR